MEVFCLTSQERKVFKLTLSACVCASQQLLYLLAHAMKPDSRVSGWDTPSPFHHGKNPGEGFLLRSILRKNYFPQHI